MPGWTLPMKILCQSWFQLKMKKLPVDWKNPSGDPGQDHFSKAFPKAELMMAPPMPRPYFWNASMLKSHGDTADKISDKVKTFCDAAIDKTAQALDMWRLQAKLKDLKIMSVCVIGTPGCLDGPKLKDTLPYKTWIGKENNEKVYIKAVVDGMTDAFDQWQSKVMVPGLPWYPAFAAYPGPMAPPMPSIPMPLIVCPSPMMVKMAVFMQLKSCLIDAFKEGDLDGDDTDKQHDAIFESIAMGLATNFLAWLPMQQIMLVMGKGPVPTFAPPYVPVGPVVSGGEIPGVHFIT